MAKLGYDKRPPVKSIYNGNYYDSPVGGNKMSQGAGKSAMARYNRRINTPKDDSRDMIDITAKPARRGEKISTRANLTRLPATKDRPTYKMVDVTTSKVPEKKLPPVIERGVKASMPNEPRRNKLLNKIKNNKNDFFRGTEYMDLRG